jgi:hypothetical protein
LKPSRTWWSRDNPFVHCDFAKESYWCWPFHSWEERRRCFDHLWPFDDGMEPPLKKWLLTCDWLANLHHCPIFFTPVPSLVRWQISKLSRSISSDRQIRGPASCNEIGRKYQRWQLFVIWLSLHQHGLLFQFAAANFHRRVRCFNWAFSVIRWLRLLFLHFWTWIGRERALKAQISPNFCTRFGIVVRIWKRNWSRHASELSGLSSRLLARLKVFCEGLFTISIWIVTAMVVIQFEHPRSGDGSVGFVIRSKRDDEKYAKVQWVTQAVLSLVIQLSWNSGAVFERLQNRVVQQFGIDVIDDLRNMMSGSILGTRHHRAGHFL